MLWHIRPLGTAKGFRCNSCWMQMRSRTCLPERISPSHCPSLREESCKLRLLWQLRKRWCRRFWGLGNLQASRWLNSQLSQRTWKLPYWCKCSLVCTWERRWLNSSWKRKPSRTWTSPLDWLEGSGLYRRHYIIESEVQVTLLCFRLWPVGSKDHALLLENYSGYVEMEKLVECLKLDLKSRSHLSRWISQWKQEMPLPFQHHQ